MDKNAIKKFAVWARRELIARVSQKAVQYGIEENSIVDGSADTIGELVLTVEQKKQRQALIAQIKEKGYQQVMEEVAYTWFNRLIALRFMEVNNYLPSHVRVFTDEDDNFKPQIITEAIHLELDGLDMEKVYALKEANQTEELYRYLLITQCNALNQVLPKMFQKISDYTELLLPDNLLREGSVIEQMLSQIPQEDWQDAVQIIGWLYQYYNAEKKDKVFAALKKNVKITKENIPAATQLFTPDWIVRYMVENSLGRLWVEGHPNDDLKASWKYYLEEAEQEPEVQVQLAEIRKEYAAMKPEEIKCIDPCCGSGHILVYLFDVLVQIYESYGYTTREAVENIIKNNLYGLDIDDRAAQLAYFAVMMKARQYDRRFFSKGLDPHIYAIQESNTINRNQLKYFGAGLSDLEKNQADMQIRSLLDTFQDSKEYGSILQIEQHDWELLYRFVFSCDYSGQMEFEAVGLEDTKNKLYELVQIGATLAQKYDVVCTNPPYMGSSGMSGKLSEYAKKNYPDTKSDLFAVLMESCGQMTKKNGYQAMITQHAWMFLASYENLRRKMLQNRLINMAHLGARAFDEISGEVVQTVSFVFTNSFMKNYLTTYVQLTSGNSEKEKETHFLSENHRFYRSQEEFKKIQGTPYTSYWASDVIMNAFANSKLVGDISDPRVGMATANNDRFVRLWHEIECCKFGIGIPSRQSAVDSRLKWFPFAKGGEQRKWYGNNDTVVNWENDGFEIQNFKDEKTGRIRSHNYNLDYIFSSALTWTVIGTEKTSFRYCPVGFLYSNSGYGMFCKEENIKYYLLGFMNSKIATCLLQILSPSMGFESGYLRKLPLIFADKLDGVISFVKSCVQISREEWDSFETSWDFTKHPLVRLKNSMEFSATDDGRKTQSYFLQGAYRAWESECDERFNQLKANEEELNRIFIDIYGLQDELTPEVDDKDVTVRKADLQRDIKSLISYAVGCMFGRYSLNVDGLAYAGGEWDSVYNHNPIVLDPEKEDGSTATLVGDFVIGKDRQYHLCTFPPDKENIIPICDDEYFTDDIVGRFVKFIEIVYGKDTLEENLRFIADALSGKGQPKEVIRNYFLNDFYADHCKIYQKRPIYWLFDSGKKNGFKALIYMHRYQPDTIARIRTDYVHEQQARYRTAIADLEQRIASAATSERVKLNKALTKLKDQDTELRTYEEKIHHLADQMIAIDLDDGVKVNYAKFQDVLAKIK